jgi:hypothetical protein
MGLDNIKSRWLCLFFHLFALLPCSIWAQDLAELEVDHALTFEAETPHIQWARPYAGGSLRVLFLTDGRGTNPRE